MSRIGSLARLLETTANTLIQRPSAIGSPESITKAILAGRKLDMVAEARYLAVNTKGRQKELFNHEDEEVRFD